MSIYSSSNSPNCSGDQSPINLSQATASPCDLLCEVIVDNAVVSQADVVVSNEGLVLKATTSLGSCKYNGEGYMCNALIVNHPSHHTVEGIQADGEVIAMFKNPTGKYLCVSSLFRVNPSQSPSTHFFNSFIPYANTETQNTRVNLGDNWSLSMMMPTNKGYFVYDGSMPWECQTSTKWVVNKAMINMDATTFSQLTRNVAPGSKSIQPTGNREVFFNNIQNDNGVPTGHGDKKYMRFKLVGKLKDAVNSLQNNQTVDLKGAASKKNKNFADKIIDFVTGEVQTNGAMYYVSWILFTIAFSIGIYAGMNMFFIGTYVIDFHQNLPDYLWYILTWLYNMSTFVFSLFKTDKKNPLSSTE